MAHLLPPHLGPQPPIPLPFLGPEPALRGGFPSHWFSFCDLQTSTPPKTPLAGKREALSIAPITPTPQALPSHWTREGPRQRRGTRDTLQGEGSGWHTTRAHSSLSSPTTLACNSPNYSGTLRYTPPTHTHTHPAAFLQLVVLQPQSHVQLGRRVKWGGGRLLLGLGEAHLPPPSYRPPLLEVALQTPLGLGLGGWGWELGGQASGAP